MADTSRDLSTTTWPGPIDWLPAAVIGLLALAEELRASGGAVPELWAAGAVPAAALVLARRRWPVAVMAVFTGIGLGAYLLAGRPPLSWQWHTALLLLFTVLSLAPAGGPRGVAGIGMTALFLSGLVLADPAAVGEHLVAGALALVAGVAGVTVRRRREHGASGEPPRATEAPEAAAVARERARIARELYDLVAHDVSVMVLQAGGVRLLLPRELRQEREALALIEETGRGAVEELHRTLDLLRTAPDGGGTTPQPTLDRLAELVTHLRSAGLDVALRIEGTPRPLPAGLDLSAYRIAQDALANVLKHAGPTHALVRITHGDAELRLEITGEGPRAGRPEPAPPPGGDGLTGIRERVALFRGAMDAGPREDGGYRVHAVLPLPPSGVQAAAARRP
ncbi:Nitrate/nitrite sensor protein NarX [Nonomuraea coxensis DSM 45129]|uniref:histidine kinase n=1 Tax=Nonomuraea coxensis DSM 45129 TaxID=1122611 RepID=A0ABX8UCV1_9ACTN|nr:sensor histidine kinase [Nonomuraea coxensis]QYC45588.1 Nitrate/nitrite sensor protein NarX [Nonomuraea coxensis DSM 45129]